MALESFLPCWQKKGLTKRQQPVDAQPPPKLCVGAAHPKTKTRVLSLVQRREREEGEEFALGEEEHRPRLN